jgi:L-histidine N-alpha-methyltransferase
MRLRVDVHMDEASRLRTLEDDVRRGLAGRPPSLPPKYFYDETGSALFERITELPEYYLTRVERAMLDELAPRLVRALAPGELVELGPGSSAKTRCFLDAMDGDGRPLRYVPVDVDGALLQTAGAKLVRDYPTLEVHAIVADFERHLAAVPPRRARRLVLFLGSTIGNLDPPERRRLLRDIAALLGPADRLLLGVDLVKDVEPLEAAYNDAAGVTAEFNRNILRVVNAAVGADFRPEAFRHLAFYNPLASRIEMHLVAAAPQLVRLGRLGTTLRLEAGEAIWTESSYKFTRRVVEAMLAGAGLALEAWHTDAQARFGLALARPAEERA